MQLMAAPKKRPVGRPLAEETVPVCTRVSPLVKDVLEKLGRKNKRTLSAEILMRLEHRMRELGEWPEELDEAETPDDD